MDDRRYNVAVIGGGIIGCAIARELGQRFDNVLLIEKEEAVGCHTSGRNSGVIHSGFNPRPGTLKATLCVEGSRQSRQFCREHNIPCEQVGTYVIAEHDAQRPILEELQRQGTQNGVAGLEILSIDQVREREPYVKGVAALYSPTGAIVDSKALTQIVARDAEQRGVRFALGRQVTRVQEKPDAVLVSTPRGEYRAGLVINCAGLYADRIAHMMGVAGEYVVAPFRGEYFEVNGSQPPIVRSMIYPIPNPLVPFLGVHLTRTVTGSVLVGPNAVPAFGREAYRRTAVNLADLYEIVRHKGFWNACRRNTALIKIACNELRHSYSKRHFFQEAGTLISGLRMQDLSIGRRVGIRPQLIRSDGRLVDDLVIAATPRSIHVLNVVSPGMTSALAFGKWVSTRIDNHFRWTGSETTFLE